MFRGRRLQTLQAAVLRPTQDRVREALFSALAEQIPGCAFLDLYAGIGTVGIEAWSRGAARVCWVESQRRIFKTLGDNVRALSDGASDVRLEPCCMDVRAFCKRSQIDAFDVVYADPPYARNRPAGEDVLGLLAGGTLVKPGGVVVLEQGADEPADVGDALVWRLVQERRYGGSVLRYFVRGGEA